MYNYFKMIEKEFHVNDFVNLDKIQKAKVKKIDSAILNVHEKNMLNHGHSFYMFNYNTVQGNLYSYYMVRFDEKKIIDIFKVNISYKENEGYYLHSVSAMIEKNKELRMMYIMESIINDKTGLFEENIAHSSHDDIAYIINPIRNEIIYFQ